MNTINLDEWTLLNGDGYTSIYRREHETIIVCLDCYAVIDPDPEHPAAGCPCQYES